MTETQERLGNSGWVKYSRIHPRTLSPPPRVVKPELFERATQWILPWTIMSYPGYHKGIVAILGCRWKWGAIRMWCRRGINPNPDACLILADYIERRCEAGLALVAQLREHVASRPPRKPQGLQVVRDRDGSGIERDGRGRGARPKTSP